MATPSDERGSDTADLERHDREMQELRAANALLLQRIEQLEARDVERDAGTFVARPVPAPTRPAAPRAASPTSRRAMLAAAAASAVIAAGVWDPRTEADAATLYVLRDEGVIPGTDLAVWRAESNTATVAQFTVDDSFAFSGDNQTFTDPVLYLGWNIAAGSAQIDPTKASAWLDIEADYWTDGGVNNAFHHQTEIHLVHAPPFSTGATQRRVFSSQVGWDTNLTDTSIHADRFDVIIGGDGNINGTPERRILSWDVNGPVEFRTPRILVFDPYSGTAYTEIALNQDIDTPGSQSWIRLASHIDGDAGVVWGDDVPGSLDRWALHRALPTGFELTDLVHGRPHAAFDAPTPALALSQFFGHTIIRGEPTQTDPVFEVVDTAGNVVFAIQADGSMFPVPAAGGIKMLGTPVRVYDSRAGSTPLDVAKGAFVDETRVIDVLHGTTIPSTAVGVFANLAVTGTSPGGFGTLWRNGLAWPGTASINWSGTGGTTLSNSAPTAIDAAGLANCRIVGTAHVVIDVVGYFT